MYSCKNLLNNTIKCYTCDIIKCNNDKFNTCNSIFLKTRRNFISWKL